MYVSKVVIQNVGPFGPTPVSKSEGYSFKAGRHEFELRKGTVGIFGVNGSGKTSFLDLIYACITNDFTRIDKVRADCINHFAGPGDEAFVSVVINHDGGDVYISRGIDRVRGKHPLYELKVAGGKTYTSPQEGDSALKKMGIDKKVLDFCVFKRQPGSEENAIDDFLRMTPAVRASAYMPLNETEHCALIYDVLGELLAHDDSLRTEFVDNSDELAAFIGQLEATLAEHLAHKKEMESHLLKDEHRVRAEAIISMADRLPVLLAKKKRLASEAEQERKELAEIKAKVAARQSKFDDASVLVKKLTPYARDAEAALKQWESYSKNQSRCLALMSERESWRKKRDALKPPAPTNEPRFLYELEAEKASLKASLDVAQKMIFTFKSTGLTECPTCGTEVADFEDSLREKKKLLEQGPAQLNSLQARITALKGYESALRDYNNQLPVCEDKMRFYEESIAALPVTGAPELDKHHLEAAVDELKWAEEDLQRWSAKLVESQNRLSALDASSKKSAMQLAEVEGEIKECYVDDRLLRQASKRLDEHDHAMIELAAIRGRVEGVETMIDDKKSQLEDLRQKMKRNKKLRRAVKIINRVRDAYHKQALPQRVAQGNLAMMESDINKNLAQYGEPFWVEVGEDLTFMVHKPGEPPHRAERLSGGQKILLALSFWPAVNSLYRKSLGMLVLDEPTANLDEANTSYLCQALAGMSKEVRGRRQVIVVSLAESLKTSFDQVLVLARDP